MGERCLHFSDCPAPAVQTGENEWSRLVSCTRGHIMAISKRDPTSVIDATDGGRTDAEIPEEVPDLFAEVTPLELSALGRRLGVPDPRARRTDPDTSHGAAASMVKEAEVHRGMIWGFLVQHGPHNADECDQHLDLRVTSSGRRLPEMAEVNLVQMLHTKRPTRSGRPAHLWRALPE